MLDERLSDEDITNIKVRGSGCFDFIVTVIVAVIVTLLLLHYYPVLR